jgi:FAD:protein FMN transferase
MNRDALFVRQFHAMGSPCEVQLFAASERDADHAIGLATAEIARLEAKYSRYRDDSFLSAINRAAAAADTIEVDPETAGILDYAAACHAQSGGLFDITSGILRRAWNFKGGGLPDPEKVASLLSRVGWDRVVWQSPCLRFPVACMEIDFGGIVKEFAVDRVAVLLAQAGCAHSVVNLGGDIRIVGPRRDESPWRIGVRDPRNRSGTLSTIAVTRGAVATSGDYERCIVADGVRYGHILNPRTGWPVAFLAAATVVGELCTVAGSASTIALLKEADGPAWLRELGMPFLCVDVHGNIDGTPDLLG